MSTARDIVTKAMQKIGAVTKSESPSSDEINDGVSALNMLLDSLANDGLMVYARAKESFSVSANDGQYTIGSGGDFNTTRPISIISAFLTSNLVDYPLSMVSDEIYASLSDKTVGGIPYLLNYGNENPLGTIKLYPVPTSAYTLTIYSEKPYNVLTADTTLAFPPGWERMAIYNLAAEIAPEYGQQVDQAIYDIARKSMAAVKRSVAKWKSMDVNPSVTFSMTSSYMGVR